MRGVALGLMWVVMLVAAGARAQLGDDLYDHDERGDRERMTAVVVLIGEAGDSEALKSVISELLVRQGVTVQLEQRARFEPEAWLDTGAEDVRTYAFVAVPDGRRAQLYFRGPRGERFLLRELTLRAGLDEVGRELIAGVVETSTVTLLRSTEGVSREEARAELAKAATPVVEAKPVAPAPAKPPAPPEAKRPAPRTLFFAFGPHAALQATGKDMSARIAAGLDLGLVIALPGWPRLRPRISVEGASQVLETPQARAEVSTLMLRAGLDVALVRGLYLGVSTGLDQVHVVPRGVSDDELTPSHATTERLPSSRAELRYEVEVTETLRVGLGAVVDVPWKVTHYDVIRDGAKQRAASSFAVQPGALATFSAEL